MKTIFCALVTAATTFAISSVVAWAGFVEISIFLSGDTSLLKTSKGTEMCTGRARLTRQLAKACATTSAK